MKLGQHLTGNIESMAFGGEGILRHEGAVIFIPFVAIGDEVRVELTHVKKSFARGKLLSLIKGSTNRVTPRCPHFGVCGGCQLQHVPYDAQLTLKHDWVLQSLKRIGKLTVDVAPVIGAAAKWNYRRVVKLRFQRLTNDWILGYVNANSNGVVNIRTCPIFSEEPSLFENLKTFLRRCFDDSAVSSGTLSLFRANTGELVAYLEIEENVSKQMLPRFEPLPPQIKGLLLFAAQRQHVIADTSLQMEHAGQTFQYTPLSFVQNHEEQSAKINAQIAELVLASGAQRILDLYCGFGVTAIHLAQSGLQVTGVESNQESIRLAENNAKKNNVEVEWVCADVAHFLGGERKASPELIIVNPPRTGLSPSVVEALSKNQQCIRLIYVSCMPQTLARDLAILTASGFEIELCQPYDMFPQTTHVETLVSLRRLQPQESRGKL